MTSMIRIACTAAVVCLLASSAAAQDPLARRVSLDVKAMAPAEAFKMLADAVGLRATVDADVTAPVDVLVRNVKARTALDTICDSIDCRWTLSNGTIAVTGMLGVRARLSKAPAGRRGDALEALQAALKQPLPAGTRFENVPVSEVVDRLSAMTGVKISVAGGVAESQKVTIDVSHLALMSAIRRIAEPLGARFMLRAVAKKDAANAVPPELMIVVGPCRTPRKGGR